MDYEYAKQKFTTYVETFDMKNKNILLKYYHSLYVARWMEKLAKRMHASDEEIVLSKILGLLHDIGRFSQIEKTNSYDDQKIDHAKEGCEYLFEQGHIREYLDVKKYDSLIKAAILNHNTYKIDKKLDEMSRKFTYMLRDMDKLDIFRVSATYFENELIKEDLSKPVLNDFKKQILINRKKVKTNSDEVLFTFAYLFDIHFKESFELLEESDNVELYIGSLQVPKYSEEFAYTIFKETRNYLHKELEE